MLTVTQFHIRSLFSLTVSCIVKNIVKNCFLCTISMFSLKFAANKKLMMTDLHDITLGSDDLHDITLDSEYLLDITLESTDMIKQDGLDSTLELETDGTTTTVPSHSLLCSPLPDYGMQHNTPLAKCMLQ